MNAIDDMKHARITPSIGEWVWSRTYQEQARVIEKTDLWGASQYRIWLPNRDAVVLVPDCDIQELLARQDGSEASRARYLLMAAKLANLVTEDVLLAPIDASVIPLPHQIKALRKAISRDRVRFLLADEVGLGKTIEAGLIMREMKLRGLVNRTLIVSPKGLIRQWISEMRLRFGEDFKNYAPVDFQAYRRIAQHDNVWESYPQIICSVDSVKPVDSRKGWSDERLSDFNRERFQDLVTASWDLIIVDESHKLGGSSEQVARYQLGKALAEAAPYLLLLTATPHQGKTDAFHRLIALLDPAAFPDPASVTKERVLPYVIRTEKRQTIDADGKALFKPRMTRLVTIEWRPQHRKQRLLYEAVTDYVREGYNQALKEKKGYIGFLMLLMQRLVTSSTRAIAATLDRRLEVLRQPEEQMSLFPEMEEDWLDLDGQEQLEAALKTRLKALKNEAAEVRVLLNLAKEVEAGGPDAKADALLEWLYRLQQEEADPDLKFLIFTEFVSTQEMLEEFLLNRGFSVVCLNGGMDMDQRIHVQTLFSKEVRILVSTDAGGEGLNLQFCHVVINYDMPWNPMRVEQRIGRVDRIGQEKIVRAMNFVSEGTVEHRVREVLEDKLAVILQEFGVDKTSDVLDSSEAGNLFDTLYIEALLNPEHLDDKVDRVAETIRREAHLARAKNSLFDDALALRAEEARQASALPLADWVETMTANYLEAFGGELRSVGEKAALTWPKDTESRTVVFSRKGLHAEGMDAEVLSLEHPRIRGLISKLPCFAEGQPVFRITLEGMPANIRGYWSLWQITMHSSDKVQRKIMPLFVHDDGRNLQPTARFLWDQMNSEPWSIHGRVEGNEALQIFQKCKEAAMVQGHAVYLELRQRHLSQMDLESQKAEYSFKARRRLLANVGLDQVKAYRLRQLEKEEAAFKSDLERQRQMAPELVPLLMLRID